MIYIQCNAAGLKENDPPRKPFLVVSEVTTTTGSQWSVNLCPKNNDDAYALAESFRNAADLLMDNWNKYDQLIAKLEVGNATGK